MAMLIAAHSPDMMETRPEPQGREITLIPFILSCRAYPRYLCCGLNPIITVCTALVLEYIYYISKII